MSAPRVVVAAVVALAAALSSSCADDGAEGEGEAGEGEGEGDVPPFLERLDDADDVALLAAEDGPVPGAVKYVAAVDGVAPRPPVGDRCLFQDMHASEYHLPFLQSLAGGEDLGFADYQALVLRRATRAWWGGEVRVAAGTHPLTGGDVLFAVSLYTEDTPDNRLVVDDIRAVHAVMARCAPSLVDAFVFVPVSNEQRTATAAAQQELADDGIAVLLP